MVSSVRYSSITNGTGAAVVAGGALINQGQDYAAECVNRVLAAADIGNAAGQTQHAQGMIFAEFQGALIKKIISVSIMRTAGGFAKFFTGSDAVAALPGFSITNAAGVSTLRLNDTATGAGGQLAAADEVIVILELGNS
jgi:hypothetical protein